MRSLDTASSKNPLRLFAGVAVFLIFFDCLVWAVLHHFSFLTGVRTAANISFLWLYGRRSPSAWHIVFALCALMPFLYLLAIYFHIIVRPLVPPGLYGLYLPFVASLIILSYLWRIRARYFRFVHQSI